MAKKSVIARQKKRERIVLKYAKKRAELLATIKSPLSSIQERFAAHLKLQKLPRDSSKTRLRNRCQITGRGNGVYKMFKLGRTKLREMAMRGYIPGLKMDSW